LRLPYYFCMINASFFVWLFYRLTRRDQSSSRRSGVVWT
jgi:hypothetical protein